MIYSQNIRIPNLLLFKGWCVVFFIFSLFSNLLAQDSLATASIHVEGGAVIYSADKSFYESSHKKNSAAYKRVKKAAVNSTANHTKTKSLSDKLAKIERQKTKKYTELKKNTENLSVINLPRGSNFFLLYSSKKNCAVTVYEKSSHANHECKIQKDQKTEFGLQKISKINFKNKFEESSDYAFSYFSRPPPVLVFFC